jgi:hypothetical protein
MYSGQGVAVFSDSILTSGMLNNTLEEVLQPTRFDGMLMTESPSLIKVGTNLNTLEKSPKDRTPLESLLM